MELTQENFDSLQSKILKLEENDENKEKALQEERSKRKELREENQKLKDWTNEELEAFRKEKTEREEKEAKKKGKFEELLTEKDTKIAELTASNESISDKATKYDELITKQLTDKLEALPEDKRDFVSKVIDWKDYDTKVELLDWFYKEYNPENEDFNNKPKGWDGVKTSTTEYQKAKESWDVWWLIANAASVES